MKVRLGDYIQEYTVKNKKEEDIPVYSVTNTQGFCRDYFGKDVASKDRSTYKIVPRGYFAYNPSRINVGSVDWQRHEDRVIVSPLYNVFSVSKELDKQYLYYYLKSDITLYFIKAIATGSVRDNLKLSMLYEFPINLPSLEQQRNIVNQLDKVNSIITTRRQQLQQMDTLIKARFVEMFGEPGTDVKGWGIQPLKKICEINPSKTGNKNLNEGLDVSFVPMPAVTEQGNIDASDIRKYQHVKNGFTYFAENDVLFAKITPCMENGKGAVAVGLKNGIGFGSTEFHVLRPIQGLSNPYWLYMLTAFPSFRKEAEYRMTGSAGQRRVPAMFLQNYKVAVPPIVLQDQFAAFVSHVNKSKATIQQSLDTTQLLLDSLMQRYFG